jgi:mannobiose 2-epimerase
MRFLFKNKIIFIFLFLIISLITIECTDSKKKDNSDILQGTFWKEQALQDIIPYWTQHAIDHEDGAFITNLDRNWNQIKGTEKYPSMISRQIFSYSVAYLFTGEEKYIHIASEGVDFLLKHGWDKKYGGWFDALDKKGNPLQTTKCSFVQFYANTGLAMYYFITHDPEALRYIEKSNQIIESKRWDNAYGGYFNILNRDLSVKSNDKTFSCGVVPVSGYLLYLYLATREKQYLHQAEKIMDTVLIKMQDPESKWILESFDREWNYKTRKDHFEREVNIGHNIETIWMFYRLFLLNGKNEYLESTKFLTEKTIKWGFEKEKGVWYHAVGRQDPSIHSETAYWWIQAYGNMFNLFLYRLTDDEKYIEYFKKGAKFWNKFFIDKEYGDTFLGLYLDGKIKDSKKGGKYKTAYHSMENSLLTYLYLDLWVNKKPVDFYFLINSAEENERLYPCPIEDKTVKLDKVMINGQNFSDFNREDAYVNLPATGKIKMKVTLSR